LPCAAAVYAWWHHHDPSRALEVTLSLLVVSCPCALSLAIPAALTAAHGALAKLGVLGLRPDALATLARVDRVVFDKTGTLSTGKPTLLDVKVFGDLDKDRALQLAAALERDSRHPLALALAAQPTGLLVSDVSGRPGLGLEGQIDGQTMRIGRADFAAGREDDGAVWLGDGSRPFARFEIQETRRVDAEASIALLRAQGIGVELCSGDSNEAVRRFASSVGITEMRARQLPEEKLDHVRRLQALGHVVAMVGDGLNDGPVLAGADVSLAMAEGAALAQRAADLVITSPSLLRIPQAIALARRTRRIVRQNLAWAVAYNLVALPLAATGQVTPWLAALGMAVSSLLVTLNALRLTRTAH
jgi:Cu2+-exporting ATPase